MNTKILFASVATAGLALSAHAAHAEKLEIGAQAQVLPVGTLTLDGPGLELENDTETAFGLGGTLDYRIHPNVSIGAAPRVIFNVKGDDAEDSATQLDVAARVTGHIPVAPKAELFAYASPGYSFVFLPEGELDDPSGLVLGFGGGAAFKISPTLSVVGELGYSLGFQGTETRGVDVDFTTDYLHLGVGVKAAL